MDPTDIIDAIVKLVRLALKMGIPGHVLRDMVDSEEKAMPSPEAVKAADAAFDAVIAARFPDTDPPEDK